MAFGVKPSGQRSTNRTPYLGEASGRQDPDVCEGYSAHVPQRVLVPLARLDEKRLSVRLGREVPPSLRSSTRRSAMRSSASAIRICASVDSPATSRAPRAFHAAYPEPKSATPIGIRRSCVPRSALGHHPRAPAKPRLRHERVLGVSYSGRAHRPIRGVSSRRDSARPWASLERVLICVEAARRTVAPMTLKSRLEALASYLDETHTMVHGGMTDAEAVGVAIFAVTKLTELVGLLAEEVEDLRHT